MLFDLRDNERLAAIVIHRSHRIHRMHYDVNSTQEESSGDSHKERKSESDGSLRAAVNTTTTSPKSEALAKRRVP